MFDENETMEPIGTCACGDIGYLTTRTLPIDLAHGVGTIENVPVYHCQSPYCQEFSLPSIVSRRLEEIAEQMEKAQTTTAVYTWPNENPPSQESTSKTDSPSSPPSEDDITLQTFTLQFVNRQYEDARVVQIVPGQTIIFQSKLENEEYYLLNYEADNPAKEKWFSFQKFYYEEPTLTFESFLEWSKDGYLKELGKMTLEEVETTLIDEFGEWL